MNGQQRWELVPGSSVGPVALGMSEPQLLTTLGAPAEKKSREGMVTLFYKSLNLRVLCWHGSVSMIVCELGSPVKGPHGITTGMAWREASHRLGELAYDEEEGLWFTPDEPGVLYEIARPMRSDEQPINPPYVPEAYEVSEPELAIVRSIFVQ